MQPATSVFSSLSSLVLAVFLLPSAAAGAPPAPAPAAAAATADPASGLHSRFAELALACTGREYPNKIGHVLSSDADVKPPRQLTPAFFGCFDWHSAVHGHWLLARLLRTTPAAARAAWGDRALAALSRSLTPENLATEAAYLAAPGRSSFERPYGLAWLLQLAAELDEGARAGGPLAPTMARFSAALSPLTVAAVARLQTWLPKLPHPVRSGEHSQTAFALGLALDWARTPRAGSPHEAAARALEALIVSRARAYFLTDEACPLSYEPSGEDFLSPCLAEADLLRRVLPPAEFSRWFERFLPLAAMSGTRPSGAPRLSPAVVLDPADGKLAHLDGLNLSRAFMLDGIAAALTPARGAADPLVTAVRAHAAAHRTAGLRAVTGEHYEGGHWLGSFAVYLVTGRGVSRF